MDTSMRRGSRDVRHLDIVKCYEYFLAEPDIAGAVPKNNLEKMVVASIALALEDPSSGEAHRIYNRLIGKPRETQVQITGKFDLTQSGLYQAIQQIRSEFSDVPALPSVDEERQALEFKKSRWNTENDKNESVRKRNRKLKESQQAAFKGKDAVLENPTEIPG